MQSVEYKNIFRGQKGSIRLLTLFGTNFYRTTTSKSQGYDVKIKDVIAFTGLSRSLCVKPHIRKC